MYKFIFADIGEGLHEGKILDLAVKENDRIKANDVLFSVETDKVTTDITSPVSGIVKKIYFDIGDTIKVGEVIIDIDDSTEETLFSEPTSVGVVGNIEVSTKTFDIFEKQDQTQQSDQKVILASPLARKKAKLANINLADIQGSGPNNRILIKDLDSYLEAKENNEPVIIDNNTKELSMIRRTIAKNMIKSKSIVADVSAFFDLDATNLVRIRNDLKTSYKNEGLSLTYLPFIIKALALTLIEFPLFNASISEDNTTVTYNNQINIGIAIDTPRGLVVPVINNADKIELREITKLLNNVIDKTMNNKLSINEMQNGTFTITNYGISDIKYATPIIKYPEVAILGVGQLFKDFIISDNNDISIRSFLPFSITIDHRLIDGGDVARFIKQFKKYIANPNLLIN